MGRPLSKAERIAATASIDEGLQVQKKFRLNTTFVDLCKKKRPKDILTEAVNSNYLKIFWVLFTLNIIFLFLSALYTWQQQSVRGVQHYITRIRKHVGCVIATFAVIICLRVISSEEFCRSALIIVFLSCLLSSITAWCTYGFNGKPHILLPIPIIVLAVVLLVLSINNYMASLPGQDFTPQTIYALIHLLIGLILAEMSQNQLLVRDQPSNEE